MDRIVGAGFALDIHGRIVDLDHLIDQDVFEALAAMAIRAR